MKTIIIIATFLSLLFLQTTVFAQSHANELVNIAKETKIFHHLTGLDNRVLERAFTAYDCAVADGYGRRLGILTVVDFKMPSYKKRLWVLDLKRQRVLYDTYVAHGSASGYVYSTHFSDINDSFQSSLGLYRTGRSYYGEWGYAMRLHGLDKGFNDLAYPRAIVLHSGDYVSAQVAKHYGRIGFSHGCFVVPVPLDHRMIQTLRGGTFLFAYYPERSWLRQSKFLHCSVA